MRRIWTVVILIAVAFYSAQTTYSQDKPQWIDEVEQMLEKEGWKPVRKRTYIEEKTKRFLSVTIQLKNNDTDATIDIKVNASTKEARGQFKGALTAYKVTKRPTMLNKFSGLGDENLIVPRGAGWIGITFRKGRVYTTVLALSEETARSVAQLVADKIPNKN